MKLFLIIEPYLYYECFILKYCFIGGFFPSKINVKDDIFYKNTAVYLCYISLNQRLK